MTAPVKHTGGLSIDDIIARIKHRTGHGAAQRAAGAAARVTREVIAEAFEGEHTPEGNPWKPLKRPRPGGRILRRSGALQRGATTVRFFGLTVRVVLPDYGMFQHDGTKWIPARPILPASPLSPVLRERYERAIVEAVHGT